jgi:uncharacterized DUF497 family protein
MTLTTPKRKIASFFSGQVGAFASFLVVVVHCYRAEDKVIRIISARKADAQEQSIYQR